MKILKMIFEFIKKNWKYILVLPAVYMVYKWFKYRKQISPTKPPDTIKNQMELIHDINQLNQQANTNINNIEKQASKEKQGVDNGIPTPAQVFDKEIKK